MTCCPLILIRSCFSHCHTAIWRHSKQFSISSLGNQPAMPQQGCPEIIGLRGGEVSHWQLRRIWQGNMSQFSTVFVLQVYSHDDAMVSKAALVYSIGAFPCMVYWLVAEDNFVMWMRDFPISYGYDRYSMAAARDTPLPQAILVVPQDVSSHSLLSQVRHWLLSSGSLVGISIAHGFQRLQWWILMG